MYHSLEQRVEEIEKILGLDENNNSEVYDFDILPIRNKLKELNLDFILNAPVNKLQRLKTVLSQVYLLFILAYILT